MKEPMLLKLKIDGNIVKDVDMRMGYTHKGIEGLLEGKNLDQAMYVASRICGICSIAHERAYIRTIEDITKTKTTERVKLIRTILAELERISSHMLWTGFMMHEIGYNVMFQYFWREREKVLDLFEEICGNRVHKNICKVGTIRYDLTKKQEKQILEALNSIEVNLKTYEHEIKNKRTIKKRLENVGVITKRTAEKYALVGPNARASGINNDIRKLDPYDSYADVKFKTITMKQGDSMTRTILRIKEIYESIKIIKQCIEKLPNEEIPKYTLTQFKEGEGYGRIEAARGELFYYLKIKDSKLERAKVRTPTFAYIKILEHLIKNVEIGDVPILVASIDPCFSCMERIMIAKNNKREVLTEKQFRSKYL